MKRLSREQIAKAREAVQDLRQKLESGIAEQQERRRGKILDQNYAQFLAVLRDPSLETGLEGTAELGELT